VLHYPETAGPERSLRVSFLAGSASGQPDESQEEPS
jgi:hypothetical protein